MEIKCMMVEGGVERRRRRRRRRNHWWGEDEEAGSEAQMEGRFSRLCKSARLLPARHLRPPTSCDRIQECQQVNRPSSSVCSPSVCPSLLVFGCPIFVRLLCVVLRSRCGSLEVSVFEVPVLKREAFLLPLAPFFIVKVNVCSLKKD